MEDQTGHMPLADALRDVDELLAQANLAGRIGKSNAGAIKILAEAGRLKLRVTPDVTEHLHEWRRVCQECGAVEADVTGRSCACGCGQPVTSLRPEARYATGACRVRAHRANVSQ
jgi:hypothetical protein